MAPFLGSSAMRALVLATLLAVLVSACGVKGPLYLPKEKPAPAPAPPAAAEPEKKP